MSNTSNRPIQSLEFDEIKNNLKEYLRGQEQFKDYDFEGSALSIILDLLAYNTHYQAFYANMVANESFMDSAVMRQSVVSLAKHLNYTPRSKKAARLDVDLVLIDGGLNTIFTQDVIRGNVFIDQGSIFRGKDIDGKTVNFVNLDTYKAVRRNNTNLVQNVTLYQGNIKQVSYVANVQTTTDARFTIPDLNIDIDTIRVSVARSQNDSTGATRLWTRSTDVNKLDGSSTVFFVQEGRNGFWEVYFGDGILGRAVENGNIVTMSYLTTNGSAGNGIGFDETEFSRAISSSDDRIAQVQIKKDENNRTITSYGGRDSEDADSIKFYAPRNYQAQDRAVTNDDYRAILGKEYSGRADSFFIWGGEENDPPEYGKVFISIKPKVGTRLSLSEKQAIEKSILGERNLVTIKPEVVDPDILYINPIVTVYYDESKTGDNKTSMESVIVELIKLFGTNYLGLFNKNFRMSKFSSMIDGSSRAINSNSSDITLTKRFEPSIGRAAPYTIKFDNSLLHPVDGYTSILTSEVFKYRDTTQSGETKPLVDAYLDDDGYGNIRIYKKVGANTIPIVRNIGTVDYETGTLSLRNFKVEGLGDGKTELSVTVNPRQKDIFSRRNQIIIIDEASIAVNAVPEKTVIDRSASDSSFPG
jgi:hypothetical protein